MAWKSLVVFLGFALSYHQQVLGKDSLDFILLGDWGGQDDSPYYTPQEISVSQQMANYSDHNPMDFVVALGDNFYTKGVTDIYDRRFKDTFEDVYSQMSLDIPWFVIAGNHDHEGNISAQIEYTRYSKRWKYPDNYYSVKFKIPSTGTILQIVMIDTILLCGNSQFDWLYEQPTGPEDQSVADEQWEWLTKTLNTSRADYLLVGGHYPVWSVGAHGPTSHLVENLMPLLHRNKVTAYMAGHDHDIQHLERLDFGGTVSYIVSGAGNFLDGSEKNIKAVPFGSLKFHYPNGGGGGAFAHMHLTSEKITLKFVNSHGDVLYEADILPRKL